MNPSIDQTGSPVQHFAQNRLIATIIALVAVACVLAGVFIYLQTGEKVEPISTILTAEQRAQYVKDMQAIAESQPVLTPAQKTQYVKDMQTVAESQPALTPEQRAMYVADMNAQLQAK